MGPVTTETEQPADNVVAHNSHNIMNDTDKIRISIDVAKAHKHYIDDLIKESGVNTLASLFRKSLHLFELVTKHQKSGGKVVFEHANGERETMKFL